MFSRRHEPGTLQPSPVATRLAVETFSYQPVLPPLFDVYVQLAPDNTVLPVDAPAHVRDLRSYCAAMGTGRLHLNLDFWTGILSPAEGRLLNREADAFSGHPDVYRSFTAAHTERFPNQAAEKVEKHVAVAQATAAVMLRRLLGYATIVPRLVAVDKFAVQRDDILSRACIRQPGDERPFSLESLLSARQEIGERVFFDLPFADLVRLPPTQRHELVRAYGNEVLALCGLLLRHRPTPYLRDADPTMHAPALADCLARSSVHPLDGAIQRHSSAASRLIDAFIADPLAFPEQAPAVVDGYRTRTQGQREREREAAARETAEHRRVLQEELEALLVDPAVQPDLARLEPDTVVRLSEEGTILSKGDMLQLVEKHLRLASLVLWRRASDDGGNLSEFPIVYDRAADDVNAGMLLAEGFYGRFENIWIGVLPADEHYVRSTYRRGSQRLDMKHLVRLCVAADLRSSGGPSRTFTNMVDVTLGIRTIPRQAYKEVAHLLRKPSKGKNGADYLRLSSHLKGMYALGVQLARAKQAGAPGLGKQQRGTR